MTGVRSSTVDSVLTRSARRTPERTALRYAGRAWTYRELDEAVTTAAAALTGDHALNPGDRDAIVAEGERLLGFAAPAIAVRDVRFVPVRSG